MSRSKKKILIFKKNTKGMKRLANKIVRRKLKGLTTKPEVGYFKKVFETYDICDHVFVEHYTRVAKCKFLQFKKHELQTELFLHQTELNANFEVEVKTLEHWNLDFKTAILNPTQPTNFEGEKYELFQLVKDELFESFVQNLDWQVRFFSGKNWSKIFFENEVLLTKHWRADLLPQVIEKRKNRNENVQAKIESLQTELKTLTNTKKRYWRLISK